jgi:hypothetical protein
MAIPTLSESPISNAIEVTSQGKRARRQFSVIADTPLQAIQLVGSIAGVVNGSVYVDPQGGQPYPELKCTGFTPTCVSAPSVGGDGLYNVDATYELGGSPTRIIRRNPEPGGPPVYLWDIGTRTITVFKDRNGNPIVNSKRAPFRNGVPDTVPAVTLEVRWFTEANNVAIFAPFAGATNLDIWQGFAPGKVRCNGITPQPADANGATLYLNTAKFETSEDGFPTTIKDEDENGQLLNGNGVVWDDNYDGSNPPTGATLTNTGGGVFITYYTGRQKTFADLGI